MIKYDKKNKKISVPSGLGNLKITVNEYVEYQEAPKCPELDEITITENGVYDGLYNTVIVDVKGYDEGFQQGFDSGVAEQKSKLGQITITKNGTYKKEDGYNSIVVDVPNIDDGSYDEGFAAGIEEQKSKLKSISIYKNGIYTKEDGYKQITVDVSAANVFTLSNKFIANFTERLTTKSDALTANILFYALNTNTTYNILENSTPEWASDVYIVNLKLPNTISKLDKINGRFSSSGGLVVLNDCDFSNIRTTTDAFRDCECCLVKATGLGNSFVEEQNVVLPKYTFDFYDFFDIPDKYYVFFQYDDDDIKQMQLQVMDSLYDFSKGANKYDISKSKLIIQRGSRGFDDDVISKAIEKGWIVEKE